MREILFRGKQIANGKWVYGFYVESEKLDKSGIEYFIIEKSADGGRFDVIPETVGQYTGLTDKSGTKIFEGDIVKTKKYGKVVGHSNVNGFDVFAVVYEPAAFRVDNAHRAFNLVGNGDNYEVIGNIHDNPDLLRGETKNV